MSTIRQKLLRVLQTETSLTASELWDKVEGLTLDQVKDNLRAFVTEKLATRRLCQTTGAPIYQLTALGIARIKPVAPTRTLEEAAHMIYGKTPQNKLNSEPNLEPNSSQDQPDVIELKKVIRSQEDQIEKLRAGLKVADDIVSEKSIKLEKAELLLKDEGNCNNGLLAQLATYQESLVECFAEIDRLNAELSALKVLDKDMPGFGFAYENNDSAVRFLCAGYEFDSLDEARKLAESEADKRGECKVSRAVLVGLEGVARRKIEWAAVKLN